MLKHATELRRAARSGGRLVALTVLLVALSLGCAAGPEAKQVDLAKRRPLESIQSPREPDASRTVRMSFDLRLSPKEDMKTYLSLLAYLERKTGYKWQLLFARSYEENIVLLGKGRSDVALMGAASFVQAQERYGARALVRGLNQEGKATYRAAIVTRPNSRITSVDQIGGKAFAFGSKDSTQGHLIPRQMLERAGIALSHLQGYRFTGSHENCAAAVIRGEFDVGGMQDTLAARLAREGRIRILAFSREFPSSAVAVSRNVDPHIVQRTKQALLAFDPDGKDRAGLYQWERTEMAGGFISAKSGDYDELRVLAGKYGLVR